MKQETLEEVAERYVKSDLKKTPLYGMFNDTFIAGAKWMQERMYSEEDMIEFAKWVFLEVGSNTGKDRTNKELFNEWFEQFKKK